jgi:hypothetical protein
MSNFSFSRVSAKRDLQDVVVDVLKDHGDEYYDFTRSFIKGESWFIGVLLDYAPFVYTKDSVIFQFNDCEITVERDCVSYFCYFFKIGKSMAFNNRLFMESIDAYGGDYDFLSSERCDTKHEDGQNKICISTLFPLIYSGPEVHILVIGSSSEDKDGSSNPRSGKTYEMLVEFLPRMGYRGAIYLFDPYETDRDFYTDQDKSFHVVSRRERYDYNRKYYSDNGVEFTHVFDDVWVPMITRYHDPIDPMKIKKYDVRLDDGGRSKFAYSYDEEKQVVLFKNGLKNHKDLPNAIGGGHMYKQGQNILIYYSSNRVGHYDKHIVMNALYNYKVTIQDDLKFGRKNFDPDNSIFCNYKSAIISCKYFGESIPVRGVVWDQPFYTGIEKRFIYNMDERLGFINWYGCGCIKCFYYGAIIGGMKNYDSKYDVRRMLSTVIDDSVISDHLTQTTHIMNLAFTYSHAKRTIKDLVEYAGTRLGCDYGQVYRVLCLMKRFGKIDLLYDEGYKLSYNIPYEDSAGLKFYSNTQKGYVYFGKEGNPILVTGSSENYINARLLYRPAVIRIDEVVEHFYGAHKELFSNIDGYDYVCYGMFPCGMSRDNYYCITQKVLKDDILLDEYEGWSLLIPSEGVT